MYGYINGKITDIEASYVILENNGIGYLIYVPNPYGFMMERYCLKEKTFPSAGASKSRYCDLKYS